MKTKVKILDTPCDYLDDDIPEEIDFSGAKNNPYAKNNIVRVDIAPDVAQVFSTSDQVNNALRLLMKSARKVQTTL